MRAILFAAALLLPASARADDNPMKTSVEVETTYRGWIKPHGRSNLASIAERDIGATGPQLGLPSRLWCGDAINRWRRKAGLRSVPSRRASDQARYGISTRTPVVGALMITGRKGGGHVDVITAVHADGTVTVVRPNWSRRVAMQRVRPRGRIVIPS